MNILVTGAAGFIGFHLSQRLAERGDRVLGIDNLNNYYDVTLKQARLEQLKPYPNFQFQKTDIADREAMDDLFTTTAPDVVVNLAAQAGVRYSLKNPHAYADSNLVGFVNILEGCRQVGVKHLVFASSSSVYGANPKLPWSVDDNVDHPLSLYAATKKANELMAHTYSHLYNLPTTGLRFFTVYGPWGRPDMSYFLFTKAITEGKAIDVFNHGKSQRDFTYVDDVIEGIVRLIGRFPTPDSNWSCLQPAPGMSHAPYRIYNIGNNDPVGLMRFIEVLERKIGRKTEKNFLPMQAGDVPATYADVDKLIAEIGYKPKTSIEEGLAKFVDWYSTYYGIKENVLS